MNIVIVSWQCLTLSISIAVFKLLKLEILNSFYFHKQTTFNPHRIILSFIWNNYYDVTDFRFSQRCYSRFGLFVTWSCVLGGWCLHLHAPSSLGLLDIEDKNGTIFRNVGNRTPQRGSGRPQKICTVCRAASRDTSFLLVLNLDTNIILSTASTSKLYYQRT